MTPAPAPAAPPTGRALAMTSLLVHDYDAAIAWFTTVLDFDLLEDTPLGPHKRWVRVAPRGATGGGALLLARAADDAQRAAIGRQGAGRVWLFLHTDDFARDAARLARHGVPFLDGPRDEPYGRVGVFADLCGNRWDLIQPR